MKRKRLDPELSDAGRAFVKSQKYTLITPSMKKNIDFLTLDAETSIETEEKKEMDVDQDSVEKPGVLGYTVEYSSDEGPGEGGSEEAGSEEAVSVPKPGVIILPPVLKTIKRACNFGGVVMKEAKVDTEESTEENMTSSSAEPSLMPHAIDERLFDFVYKAGASSSFHVVAGMFNKPLNLGELLLQHAEDLDYESQRFSMFAGQSRVDCKGGTAVHVQDCVSSKKNRSAVYKKCQQLPTTVIPVWCPKHSKACKLIYDPYGFLLYLHSRYLELCENQTEVIMEMEVDDEMEENMPQFVASEHQPDEVEHLEPEIERALVDANTISTIERTFPKSLETDVSDPNQAYMMLPMLPCFAIDGKSYLLLSDIQKLFEIREDTALGILAHNLEDCKTFIEEDGVEEEQMEFSMGSFDCLKLCFEKAKKYREETLPTEEEFRQLQTKMKLFEKPDSAKRWLKKKPVEESSSIDLYRPELLASDEAMEEADEFLRRHKRDYHGRDAALSHYLQDLLKGKILVYHNSMSHEGVLANFVFKTLARFLGGFTIPQNYDKIILVERLTALDSFGYQPGHVGSRRSYFYTYTALALSMGIESPEQLIDYGKHMMLRYRKPVFKESNQKMLQL